MSVHIHLKGTSLGEVELDGGKLDHVTGGTLHFEVGEIPTLELRVLTIPADLRVEHVHTHFVVGKERFTRSEILDVVGTLDAAGKVGLALRVGRAMMGGR